MPALVGSAGAYLNPIPKNRVAPMEAGRLFPNRMGIAKAAHKLVFFAGLNTLESTVLSPNLPAVSKAILVMIAYPFLSRKMGPGSKITLLTLLIPLVVEITGAKSKLNPNLSLYKILIPVATPIENVFEKFQVVVLLFVETMGRKKLIVVKMTG
jgi:hypothetical protein